MSHTPSKSQPILRPDSRKLDSQLASLDRAHQNRQNSKAVPVRLSPPKRPKPR